MTAIYIIDHTDTNEQTFAIAPNGYDGPGSITQHTNLRLYGAGALAYGEGVDENFLRILENFSSPEDSGAPGTPDAAYFNDTYSIKGQLWYNSTTDALMVYDGTVWKSSSATFASATAPPNPLAGALWYDTSAGSPPQEQLKVYNGVSWESVAQDHLRLDGTRAMLADLNMDTNKITNLAEPTAAQDAATMNYVDTEVTAAGGDLSTHTSDLALHLTAAQDTLLDGLAGTLSALDLNALDDFDPTGADDTGTVQVQLDKKVSVAGDTMTGALVLNTSSPGTALQAASKGYVDAEVLASTSGVIGSAERFTRYWATQHASASDGDIHTSGANIYIKANGVWKKVFPAVYS